MSSSSAPDPPERGRRTRWRARGARVTIVDRSHPREKPCGGGVTGRALALVAGALAATSLPACRHPTGAVSSTRRPGRSATVPLDRGSAEPDLPARRGAAPPSTPRSLMLRADAGATLVDQRAVDVAIEPDGVRIETTGGRRSRARVRDRRRRRQQPGQAAAGACRFAVTSCRSRPATSRTASRATKSSSRCSPIPPGTSGRFRGRRISRSASARRPTPARRAATLRDRTAAWIRDTRIADGARLEPYSWPIPSLSARGIERLEIAGPRWCAVGDAAGLVDPITREGIYFALSVRSSGPPTRCSPIVSIATPRACARKSSPSWRAPRGSRTRFFRLASTGLLIERAAAQRRGQRR